MFQSYDEVTQEESAVEKAFGMAQKEACREEVKLVAGFSHPNIPCPIGFSNEDQEQILVYEFCCQWLPEGEAGG